MIGQALIELRRRSPVHYPRRKSVVFAPLPNTFARKIRKFMLRDYPKWI